MCFPPALGITVEYCLSRFFALVLLFPFLISVAYICFRFTFFLDTNAGLRVIKILLVCVKQHTNIFPRKRPLGTIIRREEYNSLMDLKYIVCDDEHWFCLTHDYDRKFLD